MTFPPRLTPSLGLRSYSVPCELSGPVWTGLYGQGIIGRVQSFRREEG